MLELKTFVVYYGENGSMKTTLEAESVAEAQAYCEQNFYADELPVQSIEEVA